MMDRLGFLKRLTAAVAGGALVQYTEPALPKPVVIHPTQSGDIPVYFSTYDATLVAQQPLQVGQLVKLTARGPVPCSRVELAHGVCLSRAPEAGDLVIIRMVP